MAGPEVHPMVASVYDWMRAQKAAPRAVEENAVPTHEDVLVRLLKALDVEASRAPVSST